MDDQNSAGLHPAVLAIVAVAVGAFAIALIAHFVGWWPKPRPPATKPAVVTQSGVVLLPGETLVSPPGPVEKAPAPALPAPAPVAPPAPPTKPMPAPRPPNYAKPAPATPPPAKPATARTAPAPQPPSKYARSVCINCAVVTAISRGDYAWEVRLRFEDGSRETMQYYDQPRVSVGDAVHIEAGRLIKD